ncbi:MAG: porin, partial [Allosphingosinicella sp.]
LVMGPFSLQSELGWQFTEGESNDRVDNDDATEIWGGYADLSYFLTGEQRTYKEGAFDRPKVKRPVFEGGPGAWQIATRSDYLDLNDGGAGFRGGEQFSQIVGVNWWLNNNVKLAANYAYTYVFNANGVSTVNSNQNEIQGVGMRAQVDF